MYSETDRARKQDYRTSANFKVSQGQGLHQVWALR